MRAADSGVYDHYVESYGQHEYLVIYHFKLKFAFGAESLLPTNVIFSCSLCFVAKRYILQQMYEEVNRK